MRAAAEPPKGEVSPAVVGETSFRSWLVRRALPPLGVVVVAVALGSGALPFPCPLRALTGLRCPGCGATRALHLVLHGELGAALRMHPLVLVLVPWAATLVGVELVGHVRRGRFFTWVESRALRVLTYGVVAAALLVWIARFFGAFGGPAPP